MNLPTDPALRDTTLAARYEATDGEVFLTGTQALVRLPLMQRQRDLAAGLNTAGYVSGYRGSPIGGYDQALSRARAQLDAHHVRFVPGLNEDLAATAIWGTQQVNAFPGANYDGVFAIWYGKGPGVDRCGDVFRHANQAGSARHGGVIAIAGDDHGAKSSTVAAQTDYIFQAVSMPVLAPATVQDILDLGLHGFALSRASGLWVGFKCVTDVLETAGVVDVSASRVQPVSPAGIVMPAGGLNLRWPEQTFPQLEERLARYKLPAALAYAHANRLNANVFGREDASAGGEPARLAIVSTGKSWLDVMQALADLGIDDDAARAIGLKVMKVAMPWPLEPRALRAFCEGAEEVLVIEEKRALIESQLKEQLFAAGGRTRVIGKRDERGASLVPEWGEISPAFCARLIVARLRGLAPRQGAAGGPGGEAAWTAMLARCAQWLAALDQRDPPPELRAQGQAQGAAIPIEAVPIERIPYFCAGCPHNTSTRVPEGSRALSGIGCHYMAQWMDRDTATFTQMGGEGMTWVGQAPFVSTPHVFQNLGDGTYNHSGSLAIRQAVAAGTRMTYKILFNDAVAMTGGQPHEGALTPAGIQRQVRAEGVQTIVVATDEPEKYPSGYFEAGVEVVHRSRLDEVQRSLRECEGVSVLIYDQTCAAEKRRRRKRGAFPDPDRRAFINEAVCEGCGDCGEKSNCVAIEPVETEFGRKRRINQSSCNKDFSCVEGFCPSFVTVEGARLRRPAASAAGDAAAFDLPVARAPVIEQPYSILITGVGGTGVVTVGQILGMAAYLEGRGATVLDMAGLAQKNGAVMSFVRVAPAQGMLHAPRVGAASADAVIGCDVVVTAGREALMRVARGRTRVVVDLARTPTADFTRNPDWVFPLDRMKASLEAAAGAGAASFVDATRLATALTGDAIASNMFMLGYAYQKGLVPVSAKAIERAIELNGVAVQMNRSAFAWGRRAAVDLPAVESAAGAPRELVPVSRLLSASLDEAIARRVDFLSDYQNDRWAQRYAALVERVRAAEASLEHAGAREPAARQADAAAAGEPRLALTEAVARNLFKLMSYKDEYEVARLYANGEFEARLGERFEPGYTLRFHLAPPLFARRNARGELVKRAYGPWMMTAFRWVARLRWLRATPLDPFGRTEERRTERRLIEQYESTVARILESLHPSNRALAVELASVPASIRGFGHVKARNVELAEASGAELMRRFEAASLPKVALM